ncbi:MAG TPA: hypothetical protein DEQ77_03980 [Candidatus Omnitrophica bacterium]|nr:hypothetical protein [Candidatus Omnitrophota bacterium]
MKIALIFPRLKHENFGDPPLGLAYLAAYLKRVSNFKVSILDMAFLSAAEVRGRLIKERPDMAGVYFSTPAYNIAIEAARAAKEAGCFVAAGGPHATVFPQSLEEEVDAIVIGEGEAAFAELALAYAAGNNPEAIGGIWFRDNGRTVKNAPREPLLDLDILPYPERGLLEMERYIDNCQYFDCVDIKIRAATMISSRGCPFKCAYCQPTLNKLFGRNIRLRSPENIIAEIEELRSGYAVDAVYLHDDTLTFDRKWVEDLCRKLIIRVPGLIWGCNSRADLLDEGLLGLMRESGLSCLHIGAESASQRIIDEIYAKGIKLLDVRQAVAMAKRKNIRTMCFFMLGAPTETRREIENTISFARGLDLDEAVFNIASPMPGTLLYETAKSLGYHISDRWEDFNYYSQKAYNNSGLGGRQVKYLQLKALFMFYLSLYRLKYVLRHFYSLRGLRKLLRKIKRFF